LNLITALQNGGLRSTDNYVNEKLRRRRDATAQRLARQAQGNDRLNSHLLEAPEASLRTEVLRRSQLASVQALDEDEVKNWQTASKRKIASLRRGESAISPDDAVEDIDLRMTNIEALLSCPHANPKFLSETQMPGKQFSAAALKRSIAITHRAIAAPDCIHFYASATPTAQTEEPLDRSPGGTSFSQEKSL
jgi:hypothetical protein